MTKVITIMYEWHALGGFQQMAGVSQGDVLSPTPVAISASSLCEEIKPANPAVKGPISLTLERC